MSKFLQGLRSDMVATYKRKKKAVIKAAMAVASFKMGENQVGDGLFTFGDYSEGDELAFLGSTKDCFKLKGDFVVTACQRTIDDNGQVTLLVRDDRPDKQGNKVRDLLKNGDMEVVNFLLYLEPILQVELKDE